MIRLLISALLFCATVRASDAIKPSEPIKFRGAYIGQPLSDWADCSSGKAKVEKGYRVKGNICRGERGAISHTKSASRMEPDRIGGESFIFENQKLVEINIHVPDNDWEKLRYDLSEKLGPPLSQVPDVYQNALGARWEFNRGVWRKDNLLAWAETKVSTFGACGGIAAVFSDPNRPCPKGLLIVITTPERAGAPDTRPNSLD